MRRGAPVLFAATALLLSAQAALACDPYINTTFHTIPTDGWALGVGMQVDHASGHNGFAFTGDASLKLGAKAVLRPTAGLCRSGGTSMPVFGAGVGMNLWNSTDGKIMLNGQSGLSYSSKSGTSNIGVPIVGALHIASSDAMSFYGGAGVEYYRSSYKIGSISTSGSSTDPILFGGVNLGVGTMDFTGGIGFWMGSSTETLINAAISIPMSE